MLLLLEATYMRYHYMLPLRCSHSNTRLHAYTLMHSVLRRVILFTTHQRVPQRWWVERTSVYSLY